MRAPRSNSFRAAEDLAEALKAKRVGTMWMARCPVHDDTTPSLSIAESEDGKVLVHCFAGCTQYDVIEKLKRNGHWPAGPQMSGSAQMHARPGQSANPARAEPRAEPLSIWNEAMPAAGSLVQTYLSALV